ncbi:MAG: HDOD domain-containing protein [Desulfobacterales bacterium]|nr:HDOD domain-containing protein [Desulfobacterales bacterium]
MACRTGLAGRRAAALYDKSYLLAARARYLTNYLKDQCIGRQMDYESSELIQGILEKIPRLPMYQSRLLTQLLDEKASTDRLIEMAGTDSSLVSTVLKTINSYYYNLPSPIADFRHAVIFLGFNQIYQLVQKNSIQKSMPDTEEFRGLHAHSNLIALVSYEISLLSKRGKPMVVSITGLLHDIGKSVILLLKGNNPRLAGLLDTLNHARLGALLLRKWDIPATIHQSIEFLRAADFSPLADIPEDFRDPVAILYLAHLCGDYLTSGRISYHPGEFTLDYVEHLGFKEQPADFVLKQVLPVLKNKQHTYPEEIRQILAQRCGPRGLK